MKKILIILLAIIPLFVFSQKEEEKTFFTYKGITASIGYFDEEYAKYIWEKTNDNLNIPITFDYTNQKICVYAQEPLTYLIYGAEKILEDERGAIFEFSCTVKNEKVKITNFLPIKDGYPHMLLIDYPNFTLKYILEDYKPDYEPNHSKKEKTYKI